MKVRCACGQKVSFSAKVRSGDLNCPTCKEPVTWGVPDRVGNFKVGERCYEEDGVIIALARQAALRLKVSIILFKYDEHPEIIVASKRLASASFSTSVQLLDMGSSGEWGYVALQADLPATALADWFLRGTSSSIKSSLFKRGSTAVIASVAMVSIAVIVLLFAGTSEKASHLYESPDWKVRRAALRLANFDDDGIALLRRALKDKRHFVRIAACQELGKRNNSAAHKALEIALLDRAKTVRDAAQDAMRKRKDDT